MAIRTKEMREDAERQRVQIRRRRMPPEAKLVEAERLLLQVKDQVQRLGRMAGRRLRRLQREQRRQVEIDCRSERRAIQRLEQAEEINEARRSGAQWWECARLVGLGSAGAAHNLVHKFDNAW